MYDVLCIGVALLVVLFAVVAIVLSMIKHGAPPQRPSKRPRIHPDGWNPETGEWEDWDGTPYGAIDADMDG